jgi:DNA-3-methyladenine glycosylase I
MTAAYCRFAPDREYGFPAREDEVLFERLVLEINQAGLSWLTILNKRAAFAEAFCGFDIDRVAGFGAEDHRRLMGDAGIIRNRLKIDAAIENAKRLQHIRASHGSFAAWLDAHHPLPKPAWIALFKKTFRFTGGEIVGEFLMSLGYLPGAHAPWCPVYQQILALAPPWEARKRASSPRRRVVKA